MDLLPIEVLARIFLMIPLTRRLFMIGQFRSVCTMWHDAAELAITDAIVADCLDALVDRVVEIKTKRGCQAFMRYTNNGVVVSLSWIPSSLKNR